MIDAATIGLLAAVGFVGGIISSIVGGASLITFPTMLATGLSPIVATASNSVALTPANFVAAMVDHQLLPQWRPAFRRVLWVSIFGSGIGAVLLLYTPERIFMVAVPILIGLATLIFAFQTQVRRWTLRHGDDPALHSQRADRVGLVLLSPVAVYVGYFGAGAAVMLLAILSLGDHGDFRTVNALKNLIAGLMSVVAIVIFIASGLVAWPHTLAMCAGGVAGGFVGARLARVIPANLVRYVVIVVGCIATAIYGRRYWFGG